jgi:hypothetical protein
LLAAHTTGKRRVKSWWNAQQGKGNGRGTGENQPDIGGFLLLWLRGQESEIEQRRFGGFFAAADRLQRVDDAVTPSHLVASAEVHTKLLALRTIANWCFRSRK